MRELTGRPRRETRADSEGGRGTAARNAQKGAPEAGAQHPKFSESDRENAQLPVPPEEDSQLEVSLRPGLLADVEIIVEKIPNAIHIPNQAFLFEKDGRQFVYVENPTDNRFEQRTIHLAKRSESVLVIAEGLKPGETVALGDPTAKKKDKGDNAPSKSMMPGSRRWQGKLTMLSGYLPELYMGLSSLMVHKLRSLLTMLGMIFGVGAVVAMLSITAGVEKEMLAMIDQLGVNNIIIEAREATDPNELQQVRAISPGLTFRDYRAIAENIPGIEAITPRKRFKPLKSLPKTNQELPQLIGVLPNYKDINNLKVVAGRFFNDQENLRSEAVCVLGEAAKVNLLGFDDAIGKYIKINEVWLQVIGVMTPQGSADSDSEGPQAANRNNLVIAPLNSVMRRFDDNMSWLKDEIDGIYIKVKPGTDSIETEGVVRAILRLHAQRRGRFHRARPRRTAQAEAAPPTRSSPS